jgi:hypothetical protein
MSCRPQINLAVSATSTTSSRKIRNYFKLIIMKNSLYSTMITSQSVISVGLLLVLNLKVASLSGALKIPNLEQQDIRKLSHEGEVIQVENVRSRKHSKQASPHSPSDIVKGLIGHQLITLMFFL